MAAKELRNFKLIEAIKTRIPKVGFVNLDPNSNGRRAFCQWRGMDFLVSSKLTVKELGFGRKKLNSAVESEDSKILQNYLRAEVS